MIRISPVVFGVFFAVLVSATSFADTSELPSAEFYPSAEAVQPLLVGTKAPDGVLKTADGATTTLLGSLGGKPGIVVFFRGNW